MSMNDFMFDMNKEELQEYVTKRLLGKEEYPDPHCERGGRYIDILISLLGRKDFWEAQREWFWEAWKIAAMEAKKNDKDTYTRCLSLASIMIKKPPNQSATLIDFISTDVKDYGHKENYSNENRQLKLLQRWGGLLRGNDFFYEVANKYIKIDKGKDTPLESAIRGLGLRDYHDYEAKYL